MPEIMTAAQHRMHGGTLEDRLRAELREKVLRGEAMHKPARSLSREEIAALYAPKRQAKPAPVVVECVRPEPAPLPVAQPAPELPPKAKALWEGLPPEPYVMALPGIAPAPKRARRRPTKKPTRKPNPLALRAEALQDLLALLRCEPMSVLARHLAMGLGRQEEEVEFDLGVLASLGLAKRAASGRWRAAE